MHVPPRKKGFPKRADSLLWFQSKSSLKAQEIANFVYWKSGIPVGLAQHTGHMRISDVHHCAGKPTR
jgi:hypothetical protein